MILTKEKIDFYSQLPTGNVADNNPNGYVLPSDIKPIDPSLHLIGRAFPVDCAPKDNLALHRGIEAAKAGDVLIFDCKGFTEGGHFGDMMANACKQKGIAGVIINGSCRDSQDIKELGFPVYAKAYCPASTVKVQKAGLNQTITIGTATIHPGDLIFGDGDGVVVIPQNEEDVVMEKAVQKFEKEKEILKRILAGESTMKIYGFDKLIND
jgi:4-hydroxy-4-methyl-2-oxoglutarate aldolase